jgi:predicted nucleic acid-binding protein
MAGELYLVDTNILIRWIQSESSDFDVVNNAIQRIAMLGAIPCYTSQNLGEFWNVLTRPTDRNGYGLSVEAADSRTTDIEAAFRLLPDSPLVHQEWRELLVRFRVSGVQVHDARLVASMRVHEVRCILTFNTKDFKRFSDIEAVHPLQIVQDR